MPFYKNKRFLSILWVIFYLVIIDITVNVVFKFPDDPQKKTPSKLQEYFEFGRSIEGKFDKMAFAAKLQTDPTEGYGWLEGQKLNSQPVKVNTNQTLIAVYGMSHTKLLGDAISKVDRKYTIRSICAPGAPIDWGYAAYNLDNEKHAAKVVVWGIMTETVPFIGATLGASVYFDLGHPYTFPRHYVEDDTLRTIYPPFLSLDGFKEYRGNKSKWTEYLEWLRINDKFYDNFLFKESLTDNSAILRVIRRAYAQTVHENAFRRVYTTNGFNMRSDEVKTLQKMVENFAEKARSQNRLPIIYIVNNRDRGDHLYRALKPSLDAKKIPFLSSHTICPPDNPQSFLSDGHFTPEKDIQLAKEMINIIEKELNKKID